MWTAGKYLTCSAEEAACRIDDWFRRGYVMFSDVRTHSTHLRKVDPDPKETRAPKRGRRRGRSGD